MEDVEPVADAAEIYERAYDQVLTCRSLDAQRTEHKGHTGDSHRGIRNQSSAPDEIAISSGRYEHGATRHEQRPSEPARWRRLVSLNEQGQQRTTGDRIKPRQCIAPDLRVNRSVQNQQHSGEESDHQ